MARRIRKLHTRAEQLEREALELRAQAEIIAARSCDHDHAKACFRQDSSLLVVCCRWCGEHVVQGASGRIVVLDIIAEAL
jgi:ribosomal protein S27E